MASKVIMPKQGLLMTEGTITQWLVQEGGKVVEGEPLFEMETDKLTITMDAEVSGTLLKILRGEGETVPITQTIAVVGDPGEDISAFLEETPQPLQADDASGEGQAVRPQAPAAPAAQPVPGARVFISPRAKLLADKHGIDYSGIRGTGSDGSIIERDIQAFLDAQPKATPLSVNVARNRGIDLKTVTGSGPNGKITTADLGDEARSPEAPEAVPARGVRYAPMSGMRKAVSRNMLASKDTYAQTCVRAKVDMTAAMELRKSLKEQGTSVSYNDIIARVCAKVLREMPVVNASIEGQQIVYHDYVNIGLAVSVPGGLIVPVIRDADLIGLAGIAKTSAELVRKAHDGMLSEADYHGGTFTVTSLGTFDIDDFVAIINPPESAILAVGKIIKTPVVRTADGVDSIEIRPMCALTLSYDHRLIDGAEAAKCLQRIKLYLQAPALML